jgi:hypothetical protein
LAMDFFVGGFEILPADENPIIGVDCVNNLTKVIERGLEHDGL